MIDGVHTSRAAGIMENTPKIKRVSEGEIEIGWIGKERGQETKQNNKTKQNKTKQNKTRKIKPATARGANAEQCSSRPSQDHSNSEDTRPPKTGWDQSGQMSLVLGPTRPRLLLTVHCFLTVASLHHEPCNSVCSYHVSNSMTHPKISQKHKKGKQTLF
jgi:hypothetical protein